MAAGIERDTSAVMVMLLVLIFMEMPSWITTGSTKRPRAADGAGEPKENVQETTVARHTPPTRLRLTGTASPRAVGRRKGKGSTV
jgi:hypothetical protein